jgi:tetratricopeptide (TPR) repeat protein
LENNDANSMRNRAQAARDKVLEKLTQAAQDWSAKAFQLLHAGRQKEALLAFDEAVKADGNDPKLTEQRNNLYLKIEGDCKIWYQKAIVYQDLGQPVQAGEAYQEIIKIGVPGEVYFERAKRALGNSPP